MLTFTSDTKIFPTFLIFNMLILVSTHHLILVLFSLILELGILDFMELGIQVLLFQSLKFGRAQ